MAIVQGGFSYPVPTEGKPKKRTESTEKHHYGLYVTLIVIALAGIALASYATNHNTPAATTEISNKNMPTEQTDTGAANPSQNVNTGQETTVLNQNSILVIENSGNGQDQFKRWGTLIELSNVPQVFRIKNTDIYITNFKITSDKVNGVIENRGKTTMFISLSFRFIDAKGYAVGVKELGIYQKNRYNGWDGVPQYIQPQDKVSFETKDDPEIVQIIARSKFVHPTYYI